MIVNRNIYNNGFGNCLVVVCAAACLVAKITNIGLGTLGASGVRRVSQEEWDHMRTIGAIRDVTGVIMISLIWASLVTLMCMKKRHR